MKIYEKLNEKIQHQFLTGKARIYKERTQINSGVIWTSTKIHFH